MTYFFKITEYEEAFMQLTTLRIMDSFPSNH